MVGRVDQSFGDVVVGVHLRFDVGTKAASFCLAYHVGVGGQSLGVEGEPVIRIAARRVGLDVRRRPVGEPLAQRRLGAFDPGIAALAGQIPGHFLEGAVIKLAQEPRLPSVPHPGTNRPDVGDGEAQQQAQPFRGLHGGDEVADGLGVVDVAFEGGAAHHQVVQHQPRDGFRLPIAETEARPQLAGDAGADLRVVTVPPLGDVVQQHGEIEGLARLHLADHRRRHRMVVLEGAGLDAVQDADGADGVLVDRVDVVHVVLHLGNDAAEVGDEAPEDARLVEAP